MSVGKYADAVRAFSEAQSDVIYAMARTFPLGCFVEYKCLGSRRLAWVAQVRGYVDDGACGKLQVFEETSGLTVNVAACRAVSRRLPGKTDWEELPTIDMEGEQDEQGA